MLAAALYLANRRYHTSFSPIAQMARALRGGGAAVIHATDSPRDYRDPMFRESIVLLTSIDEAAGAEGFMVNKPIRAARRAGAVNVPITDGPADGVAATGNNKAAPAAISACPARRHAGVASSDDGEGATTDTLLRAASLPRPESLLVTHDLGGNAVFCGGPLLIPGAAVVVLHGVAGVPGAVRVAPGLFADGDAERLREALRSGAATPADMLVVLGRSGWASGQLRGEFERGAWGASVVVAPGDAQQGDAHRLVRVMNERAGVVVASATPKDVAPLRDIHRAMQGMYRDDLRLRTGRPVESPSPRTPPPPSDAETALVAAVAAATSAWTRFIPSSFFGVEEHSISRALWADHVASLASPAGANKRIVSQLQPVWTLVAGRARESDDRP